MHNSPHFPNNPNAPNIKYSLHVGEKAYFAGTLMGGIPYGIVIVLFFQCVGTLFYPANRSSGGIKWGLVAHTVLTFLFVTTYTVTTMDLQSISFVDNREFPGISITLPPGPVGYEFLMFSNVLGAIPTLMILLNNWLADGLLLHQCYVIYAMNYWAIAFPFLMYLTSIVTGVMFISQILRPEGIVISIATITRFGAPFLSVSFSLDILLTFMIVARLVLHRKNLQSSLGGTTNAGELYKFIATILIESFALKAVTFLVYFGLWGAKSFVQFPFVHILAQIQVIASFLIILRVANRRQLASSSIISGSIDPIDFRSRDKPMDGDDIFPAGRSTGSVDECEEIPLELGGEVETAIDRHHSLISGPEVSTGA